MFAPDQRDGLAEPFLEEIDQAATMPVLLLDHALENSGRGGMLLTQHFGVSLIDAGVVLLGGDRKRQDLLFAEIRKMPPVENPAPEHALSSLATF